MLISTLADTFSSYPPTTPISSQTIHFIHCWLLLVELHHVISWHCWDNSVGSANKRNVINMSLSSVNSMCVAWLFLFCKVLQCNWPFVSNSMTTTFTNEDYADVHICMDSSMEMPEQWLKNSNSDFWIRELHLNAHLSEYTSSWEEQFLHTSTRECPAQQATGEQKNTLHTVYWSPRTCIQRSSC